jgi:hypothetical protein
MLNTQLSSSFPQKSSFPERSSPNLRHRIRFLSSKNRILMSSKSTNLRRNWQPENSKLITPPFGWGPSAEVWTTRALPFLRRRSSKILSLSCLRERMRTKRQRPFRVHSIYWISQMLRRICLTQTSLHLWKKTLPHKVWSLHKTVLLSSLPKVSLVLVIHRLTRSFRAGKTLRLTQTNHQC